MLAVPGRSSRGRQTSRSGSPPLRVSQVATRLGTYTPLLEALNRHRGKGQQRVTVEHVPVGFKSHLNRVSLRLGGSRRRICALYCRPLATLVGDATPSRRTAYRGPPCNRHC